MYKPGVNKSLKSEQTCIKKRVEGNDVDPKVSS